MSERLGNREPQERVTGCALVTPHISLASQAATFTCFLPTTLQSWNLRLKGFAKT